MTTLVQAAETAVRSTAVVRASVPAKDVTRWLPDALDRVIRSLERQHRPPSGPPFARYTGLDDNTVEVEAGFPVEDAIDDDGDVVASGLPAGPAATIRHVNGVSRLDMAYNEIDGWLADHGFIAVGAHWEYYQRPVDAERDPRNWRVDVVVPYRWR